MDPRRYAHVILLISWVSGSDAQQGHTFGPNDIMVEGEDHFAHWTIPEGTITIANEGVRPRRLISNTNAMLDIVEHVRRRPPAYLANKAKDEIEFLDLIQAGSNLEGVVNAFDGDMSTYWEPEPPAEDVDLASQWWFTVDLGRVVIANRIVVRFVEEGAGDPFLLFDVLTSDGQKPVSAPAGDALEYLPLVQTLKPNRTRREFEVDLASLGKEARQQAIRHVQVVVRASDLDRGREVPDEAAYEALDPADRGRIEYTRRRDGGGEVAVSAQVYEQLHLRIVAARSATSAASGRGWQSWRCGEKGTRSWSAPSIAADRSNRALPTSTPIS